MTALGTKTICIALMAGLLLAGLPVPAGAAISDSSTEGAAITVGLFVTIVAVLFIVGFKSDMDNVFGQRAGRVNLAGLSEENALVPEFGASDSGAGLGLRWAF